jgi:hypothetical protein
LFSRGLKRALGVAFPLRRSVTRRGRCSVRRSCRARSPARAQLEARWLAAGHGPISKALVLLAGAREGDAPDLPPRLRDQAPPAQPAPIGGDADEAERRAVGEARRYLRRDEDQVGGAFEQIAIALRCAQPLNAGRFRSRSRPAGRSLNSETALVERRDGLRALP